MKAIQVHKTGEPDVLQLVDIPAPNPAHGEIQIKVAAAGLNFIDVYHRKGWYTLPLPFTPGREAAGTVSALGDGVTEFQLGDRVAYPIYPAGYAEYITIPAKNVVPVPDEVTLEQAAAVMLQGMTAHYLAHNTYPLKSGDTALVHAAAGGVGLLLVQIAKMRGARVIGTVSTKEKEDLARAAGADEIIRYTEADFEAETLRLTNEQGVEVVYDSVGKTTFEKGLNCLKPRGYMVLYGQASGPIAEFDPQLLSRGGSLFLTRPTLGHYVASREELLQRAHDLFTWMAADKLNVRIDKTFPLANAADAHRYIEARQTKGKVLLIP